MCALVGGGIGIIASTIGEFDDTLWRLTTRWKHSFGAVRCART